MGWLPWYWSQLSPSAIILSAYNRWLDLNTPIWLGTKKRCNFSKPHKTKTQGLAGKIMCLVLWDVDGNGILLLMYYVQHGIKPRLEGPLQTWINYTWKISIKLCYFSNQWIIITIVFDPCLVYCADCCGNRQLCIIIKERCRGKLTQVPNQYICMKLAGSPVTNLYWSVDLKKYVVHHILPISLPLVLNPCFSHSPSIAIYPLLRPISWNVTTQCLAVSGGVSVSECDRLNQSNWLLGTL